MTLRRPLYHPAHDRRRGPTATRRMAYMSSPQMYSDGNFTEISSAREEDPIELAELACPADSAQTHEMTGGANVIHYAAQDGHLDVIQALLSGGGNVNALTKLKAWSPLHFAAHKGRLDVVELLLQHGASVYQASANGMTPLQLAVLGSHEHVVQALLAHANAEARRNPRWVRSFEYGRCCMRCTSAFGLFCSKHHCRYCGCAVCTECSGGRLLLCRWLADTKPHAVQNTPSTQPLRVCDGCFKAVPNLKPTVDISVPGAVPNCKMLWAADGAVAPHTGVCQRCGHSTQTVKLTNGSATRTVAFRFVAVRLGHLYGLMPRQGWIAPGGAVKIQVCLYDTKRMSHDSNETRQGGQSRENEEALDPWRHGAGIPLSQSRSVELEPHLQAPDIFGLEAVWECEEELIDSKRAVKSHSDEDLRSFWQAIDVDMEKNKDITPRALSAMDSDRLFQCNLLSEVVPMESLNVSASLRLGAVTAPLGATVSMASYDLQLNILSSHC